jgi:hypothetical protein
MLPCGAKADFKQSLQQAHNKQISDKHTNELHWLLPVEPDGYAEGYTSERLGAMQAVLRKNGKAAFPVRITMMQSEVVALRKKLKSVYLNTKDSELKIAIARLFIRSQDQLNWLEVMAPHHV